MSIRKDGYVEVCIPGHPLATASGMVMVHRLRMWDVGLDPRGWHVHHKNHDKTDNRLSNLELITPATHIRRHHSERVAARQAAGGRTCTRCGEFKTLDAFYWPNRKGRPPAPESRCRECMRALNRERKRRSPRSQRPSSTQPRHHEGQSDSSDEREDEHGG